MTVTQSFKIYEILLKYFINDTDAKAVVQEIAIDNKFEKERLQLSTKEDIFRLEKPSFKCRLVQKEGLIP